MGLHGWDSIFMIIMLERIYNPAMGFSAMFIFPLDNTERYTLPAPHCCNGSCRYILAVPSTNPNVQLLIKLQYDYVVERTAGAELPYESPILGQF